MSYLSPYHGVGGDIMAFSSDFIYQLQLGNPIDDVMKSYVNLIRQGRNYVCSCPFHSEKPLPAQFIPIRKVFIASDVVLGEMLSLLLEKLKTLSILRL